MKNIFRFIILGLLAIGLVFFLTRSKETFTENEHQTIKLAVSADNPPFTFFKDNAFQGFEIDVAHALASELHYNLEILDLDFAGLIPAVKNDVVDMSISGFNITQERKQSITFSEPYYSGKIAIIAHKKHTSSSELSNTKIGVQHGSLWEKEAHSLAEKLPGITVLGFHRVNQIVQELEHKTIDAILIDSAVANQITISHPHFVVSTLNSEDEENGYGIVFKHNSPLIEKFNFALMSLKNNGTLNKITEKWFNN